MYFIIYYWIKNPNQNLKKIYIKIRISMPIIIIKRKLNRSPIIEYKLQVPIHFSNFDLWYINR